MAARGAYATGIARRQAIIDAAMALFSTSGYRATSLRDIGARAGISHAGVQRHFLRKENLLQAVLDDRARRNAQSVDLEGAETALDYYARVIELVRENARDRALVAMYATLSAEATDPEHPAHQYFVARYRDLRARLMEVFDEFQRLGVLNEGLEPHQAAIDVLAHSDGLQVQWLLDPTVIDLVGETERFMSSLIAINIPLPTPHDPSE